MYKKDYTQCIQQDLRSTINEVEFNHQLVDRALTDAVDYIDTLEKVCKSLLHNLGHLRTGYGVDAKPTFQDMDRLAKLIEYDPKDSGEHLPHIDVYVPMPPVKPPRKEN